MQKRLLALTFTSLAALFFIFVSGCAYGPTIRSNVPPVVFVHGDGESAAYWQDMVWRFESNGWPRDHLFALQVPQHQALAADAKAPVAGSVEADRLSLLTAEVDRILALTHAKKVVMVGHERGALMVRDFILHGGEQVVSHAVLSWPDAVPPDATRKLTLADFESDALKGVKSLVFTRANQPDGAFSPVDFAASYQFFTGSPATSLSIWPQVDIVLSGTVTGMGAHSGDRATSDSHFYNNLPTPKAQLEIFAVQRHTSLRLGPALYAQALGPDGHWGPFQAEQGVAYEFVTRAPGYAVTHTYRSPFSRGSQLVHLKTSRIADADLPAFSIIELERHRGRLDPATRHIEFDGQPVPPVKITLSQLQSRPIAAEIHTDMIERVVGRTWPAKESHVVRLELSQ
jgi:pimeloyl-ACP methyl ester carboxylesterase